MYCVCFGHCFRPCANALKQPEAYGIGAALRKHTDLQRTFCTAIFMLGCMGKLSNEQCALGS